MDFTKKKQSFMLAVRLKFCALLILLLGGCGDRATEPQPLDERVLARWGHMIERDFESAWVFYTPGFRQTNPQGAFARDMAQRPVRWTSVEWQGAACGEDVCDVTVRVGFRAVGAPAGMGSIDVARDMRERWVWIDGQWWYSAL